MYNKHTCTITMYQVIVDNKTCIQFNTEKKRRLFISKVKNRQITCISDVSYPWNPDDGRHNLISLKDFSDLINIPLHRVERAMKKGFLQIEYCGDTPMVVNASDRYRIKGRTFIITESAPA